MVEILSQMVEDIMKDELSNKELQSLSNEIANHNGLLDSLRSNPNFTFEQVETARREVS